MPACLSRSLGFASICLNMQDDHTSQSTISSSSCNSSVLRRTLSADMASEKWVSQSGLKKVGSLKNLNFPDDENDNGGNGFGSGAFEDVWSSIQREQGNKEEETEEGKTQTDIWSSILTQKAVDEKDGNNSAPPYIHPLVKRSSSLSEKSLEICTESLGSETGSDCFLPESVVVEEVVREATEPLVVLRTKAAGAPARSFPPPLPSLGNRGDGSANVQMRCHRRDGRLVLEAVSVPTNNCFKAERQGGRLVLSFSGDRHVLGSEKADVETVENGSTEDGDEDEEACDDVTEESEEEEEDRDADVDEELEEVYDDVACGGGGMGGGHKFLGLTRNGAGWPRRLNKAVNDLERSTGRSRAHGLNPYVYSWRSEAGPGLNEVAEEGKRAGKVEEDLFLKGGCNLEQPKRMLVWEPHCIAT